MAGDADNLSQAMGAMRRHLVGSRGWTASDERLAGFVGFVGYALREFLDPDSLTHRLERIVKEAEAGG